MNKLLAPFLARFTITAVVAVFALVFVSWTAAESAPSAESISTHLQRMFVGKDVKVNDYDDQLKEVVVGTDYLFASHDGRYVFAGPVYDTHRKIDIVAEQAVVLRKDLLGSQPNDLFVRYPSAVEQQHQITVVTDIDCPYCRKFHNSIGELNRQGVSVNYLMMPRSGANSASYAKTLKALCSSDPADNITQAMAGRASKEAPNNCDAVQLTAHMKLAQTMKIRSTPTFVLPNGELQVGLLSTDHLLRVLDDIKQQL